MAVADWTENELRTIFYHSNPSWDGTTKFLKKYNFCSALLINIDSFIYLMYFMMLSCNIKVYLIVKGE